jgi:hypothetical protein
MAIKQNVIIGAGLAGLLSACVFKDAEIYEAGPRKQNHRALLRFRDESVSKLTGIPFKKVTVYKEIFSDRVTHTTCSHKHANQYARKVSGAIAGRSIRNLDTVSRYVAPDDFYEQLVERFEGRIFWNCSLTGSMLHERNLNFISTMPLPAMLDMVGIKHDIGADLSMRPISVTRFELPEDTDVYQTIYFPNPSITVYRASITGKMLIIESMMKPSIMEIDFIKARFGLTGVEMLELDQVIQQYGKITDLPTEKRQAILHELTRDHNIYSIGRFATWRNILLDDVVQDIEHVRSLMAANEYGRALLSSRKS